MYILSMQLGHNSTIGLWNDDKRLEVVSQEKFDNIKNSSSFPEDAIKYCLDKYKLSFNDIKVIINSGLTVFPQLLEKQSFDIHNYKGSHISKIYGNVEYSFSNICFNKRLEWKIKRQQKKSRNLLLKKLSDIGFEDYELSFVEHHECHTYSPISIYGDCEEDFLIFALDGSGDLNSGTISIYKNGKIEKIAETSLHDSIGFIYSMVTKFLGMKVLEHEYKVMGLAAYAKEDYYKKTYEKIFKDVVWIDEETLTFKSKFPTRRFYNHMEKYAIGERFDNIAGALQYFTENLVVDWVRFAIKKTGIKNIMTSGGVFMNVKMNQKILAIPEVSKTFFMPSCGDESNVFGATTYFLKNKLNYTLKPDYSIYSGMNYSNQEVESFINANNLKDKYTIKYYDDIEIEIAKLLNDFKVVARFQGKTEFGARSLGNRALLANPSDMKSFYMVNDQIKVRDFWMPFAPSMLDSDADRYLINYDPKKYQPYYMICTYESTQEFQDKCRASMHQGDKTVRPQIVTKEINPKYYKVIFEFEKLSGIGAVLNTSLNIHGYPLVGTLEQAFFTFDNSGLEYLCIENWCIVKINNRVKI